MNLLRPLLVVFCTIALIGNLVAADLTSPINPAEYPKPVRVACIGDSITEGAGVEAGKSYPSQLQALLGDKWMVKNFGLSGRTLLRKGDAPYWNEGAFKAAQDFQPDVVIIMLGTNDTKPQNWVHFDEFATDYREFVETFEKLASKPKIYVCRPCPVIEPGNFGIVNANVQAEIPIINQIALEKGLGIIDQNTALASRLELIPDKVHPNTAGAGILAATAYEALTGTAAPLTR